MVDNLDVQKEHQSEYQTMFPGYQDHVYKNAFSHQLSAPDKLPAAPCHSPLG